MRRRETKRKINEWLRKSVYFISIRLVILYFLLQMVLWIVPDILCAIAGLIVSTLFFLFFFMFAWNRVQGKWGANRHTYHLQGKTMQCSFLALIVILSALFVM